MLKILRWRFLERKKTEQRRKKERRPPAREIKNEENDGKI
jgi:hypothetical protein